MQPPSKTGETTTRCAQIGPVENLCKCIIRFPLVVSPIDFRVATLILHNRKLLLPGFVLISVRSN